jgi:transposase
MQMTSTELPNDVEELKAYVLHLQSDFTAQLVEKDRTIQEKNLTIQEKDRQILWEREKLRALQMRYFGHSSEKQHFEKDAQYYLFDEAEKHADDESPPVVATTTVATHERKKSGRKPKDIPLPIVETVHELPEVDRQCPCCGKERAIIGDVRTSEYDLVPAHVVKIVHTRRKYGPCDCEAFADSDEAPILIAPAPAKIVPGSDFTNRTTAFFMTSKYADAIPFYRMEKMLERSGLVVSRAALSKQAISVGRAIGDLVELMNRDLMHSPVLLMDETTVQVLNEKDKSNESKSYMWVMRGYKDGKPIHRFVYHPSRSGLVAENLLKGFEGFYLQTDGFDGYNRFDGRAGLAHVGCFAHIRRKFVSAWEVAGKTGIAKEAIDIIAHIYRVESELREKLKNKRIDADTFLVRRRDSVEPLFARLRDWLMASSLSVAPQSALGKAITYAQAIFPRAIRFVEHPLMTPDTNAVENAIRPFVIGRKNWLFSGGPRGAHASAAIYSFFETAKANGHDPYFYSCALFDYLPLCKTDAEREALLPYNITPEEVAKMLRN